MRGVVSAKVARWPCVQDATTLAGLADLRRSRPRDWHTVMRKPTRRVGLRATIGEALRLGGQGVLLPESSSPAAANRLKATRSTARLTGEWYGEMRLSRVTEDWLRRERVRRARNTTLSGQQVGRCFTLLRKLALRAARHDKVQARVRPRHSYGGVQPRLAERSIAWGASWGVIEALMSDSADLRVRCAIALQAHVGATPGRVLAVRACDIDVHRGVVWMVVPGPDERSSRQPYALPSDAIQAVLPWMHRRQAKAGASAMLFPMRGKPSRPTTSISKAIRRAADALGIEFVTMQMVRRVAQARLRRMGGTRAQVRGSRRVRPRAAPRSSKRLTLQRRLWRTMTGADHRLPLRAPRACDADQPELRSRRRAAPGSWPSTPVLRAGQPDSGPAQAERGPDPQQDPTVWWQAQLANARREVETVTQVKPLPAVEHQAAGSVVHTTVRVQGRTDAEVLAREHQAFAVGVAVPELLRSLFKGGAGS